MPLTGGGANEVWELDPNPEFRDVAKKFEDCVDKLRTAAAACGKKISPIVSRDDTASNEWVLSVLTNHCQKEFDNLKDCAVAKQAGQNVMVVKKDYVENGDCHNYNN